MKLRPQKYDKYKGYDPSTNVIDKSSTSVEYGLVSQEVYYACENLKGLIRSKTKLPDTDHDLNFDDIKNDPDYDGAGWGHMAHFDYIQLIPFLIAGFQEQQAEIEKLKQDLADLKKNV